MSLKSCIVLTDDLFEVSSTEGLIWNSMPVKAANEDAVYLVQMIFM